MRLAGIYSEMYRAQFPVEEDSTTGRPRAGAPGGAIDNTADLLTNLGGN
jgi:hypothetical protein